MMDKRWMNDGLMIAKGLMDLVELRINIGLMVDD
jgi:hypothetical protein